MIYIVMMVKYNVAVGNINVPFVKIRRDTL